MKRLPNLLLIAALAAFAPPSAAAPPSALVAAIGDSGADAPHGLVRAGTIVEPAEADAVGGVTVLPGRAAGQARRTVSIRRSDVLWTPQQRTQGLAPHLRDRILHPSTAPPRHV